jgi:hypothetical protein
MPRAYVYYTYQDSKGAIGRNEISAPSSVDIAILSTFARSTAQLIDTLTKCKITALGIGLELALASVTGIKSAPISGSDVEEGARFTFRTSADSLTSTRIPGFDETFVDNASRAVLTSQTDVAAFIARMISGQTVGAINASPSDSYGNDIASLESARESFQASR